MHCRYASPLNVFLRLITSPVEITQVSWSRNSTVLSRTVGERAVMADWLVVQIDARLKLPLGSLVILIAS